MCLVHGGKSIPWNVSFREPCGTGMRVFPFSVKRQLLLGLWEGQRSDVPSAHSPQHTKPKADVATLSKNPSGQNQLHNSAKTQMAVCLWLSQGRFLIMRKFYTIILTGSVTPQQMSNVYRQAKLGVQACSQNGQEFKEDMMSAGIFLWVYYVQCVYMCYSSIALFSVSCRLGLVSSYVLFLT